MPKYSDESIKKHPWLYKYDDRSTGKTCQEAGHRWRWAYRSAKTGYGFVKVCKRRGCSVIEVISGKFDDNGHWEQLKKTRYSDKTFPAQEDIRSD